MDNSSTIMAKDYQYEQNPEGGGGNGEKIDGNHARHMIFQESPHKELVEVSATALLLILLS